MSYIIDYDDDYYVSSCTLHFILSLLWFVCAHTLYMCIISGAHQGREGNPPSLPSWAPDNMYVYKN